MKLRSFMLFAGLMVAQVAVGQNPPPSPGISVDPAIGAALPPGAPFSDEQLEQLLAPIALYPDALIALILPASVAATDIVLAARHLRDFPNDRSQIEHRAWDESVKSLTHYPEVLKWMDENLTWTKQVGDAFTSQPADVMQAVQRLRARARAAGSLVNTPQQQVLAEPDIIRIVPAQPDVIYVPRYEPDIVFVREPHYFTVPVISFGIGYRVGSWLAYDCDWRRRTIWIGDRHRSWRGHDWHRPVVPIAPPHVHHIPPGVRQWRPPTRSHHHYAASSRLVHNRPDIVRPAPVGAPHVSRTWSNSNSYTARTNPPTPAPVTSPASDPNPSRAYPRRSSDNPRLTMPQVTTSPAQHYTSPSPSPSPAPSATSRPHVARDHHTRAQSTAPAASAAPRVMGPQPTPAQAAASPSQRQHLTTRPTPAASASAPAPAPVAAPVTSEPPPSSTRPAPNNTTSHRGRIYNNPRDAER